jgi:ribosomal protein S18 acetylase RimI-like enzyme
LFGDDIKGAVIQRASTAEDLARAYRLVYQVYREAGYIHASPSGMRLRIFEASSDTATFVAKVRGHVVGVISVVGDSPDLGLPSDTAFKAELDRLRATGVKLCEVTNQVVAGSYRKSAVTTELMRAAVAHSLACGYRMGVATVSPSHNGFYDLLGFAQLGSERSYSSKLHDPVVALTVDFQNYRTLPAALGTASRFVHAFLGLKNPYRRRVAAWDRAARRRFLDADVLQRLFMVESNFLAECTRSELMVVRLRWGQELFRVVAGCLGEPVREEPAVQTPVVRELHLCPPTGMSEHPFAGIPRPVASALRRYRRSRQAARAWFSGSDGRRPAGRRDDSVWWSWIDGALSPGAG